MSALQTQVAVEPRLIKALGHPLRQRILLALGGDIGSPNELAKKLGEPLGNVSYHVKILAECDAIELVKTEPRRGAVEHFYRATMRTQFDDRHWAALPPQARRALFDDSLQRIWEHVSDAARAEGFDDPRSHVSWTNLELDEEAYEEMVDELAGFLDRVIELQAGALARLGTLSPEERESHRTEFVLMHFHRAEERSD
jgi:DNA-binding transcriptional ArsR family regulator